MLTNIEIGVNLADTPIPPKKIIQSALIHKGKTFNRMQAKKGKSIGVDCYHQRYWIKIYNKGYQYDLPYEVLRYELKFIKMHDLNKLGLCSIADLRKLEILKRLGKYLIDRFDEILFIEPQLQVEQLTFVEQRNFLNYLNPKYWEGFTSKKNYNYHRQRYKEIVHKYVQHPT